MTELITLRLESKQAAELADLSPEPLVREQKPNHLRHAFLGLLAANIFVISGALSFSFLYFTNQ